MATPFRILSIDGGGIRGLIPALVLAAIEDRAGQPIAQLFDLIAGTSTGGILAVGLTKPDPDDASKPHYSARDLVTLYDRRGGEIFSRSVWHTIHAAGNLVEEKYTASGIEGVLRDLSADSRLRDALTDVLVPSYDIERRTAFLFKSRRAKKDAKFDFPIWQVARATSAAPTYFEPLKVEIPEENDYYALVDGGVYANNPAMCALAEAKSDAYPKEQTEDCLVVSLGTGQLTRRIPYEQARGWGLAQWAQPILGVVFDGIDDTVAYQLNELLPERDGKRRYYRFQVRLDEGSDDMDDAGRTNIRVLRLLADDLIREQADALDEICSQLLGGG